MVRRDNSNAKHSFSIYVNNKWTGFSGLFDSRNEALDHFEKHFKLPIYKVYTFGLFARVDKEEVLIRIINLKEYYK